MHTCATRSRRRKQTTSEATKLVRTLVRRRAKSSCDGLKLDRTICLVGNIAASTLGVEHHFTIAGAEPRVDLGERPLTRNNCECVPIDRSNSEYSERLDSVYHGDQTQNNKLTPSNRITKNTTNTRILLRYTIMVIAWNHEKKGPGVLFFIHTNTRL